MGGQAGGPAGRFHVPQVRDLNEIAGRTRHPPKGNTTRGTEKLPPDSMTTEPAVGTAGAVLTEELAATGPEEKGAPPPIRRRSAIPAPDSFPLSEQGSADHTPDPTAPHEQSGLVHLLCSHGTRAPEGPLGGRAHGGHPSHRLPTRAQHPPPPSPPSPSSGEG